MTGKCRDSRSDRAARYLAQCRGEGLLVRLAILYEKRP